MGGIIFCQFEPNEPDFSKHEQLMFSSHLMDGSWSCFVFLSDIAAIIATIHEPSTIADIIASTSMVTGIVTIDSCFYSHYF